MSVDVPIARLRTMETETTLWIAWHRSRRSRTLARILNITLREIQIEGGVIGRHGRSALWTLLLLLRRRPRIIFLQYSFLLLIILAIYKRLVPYSVLLVGDCHTKALRRQLRKPLNRVFMALKRWSLATANLLIVSNEGQVPEAKAYNHGCLVFPDPVPEWPAVRALAARGKYVVFVMSYAEDEPIEELFQAAELLSSETEIHITGRTPTGYRHRFDACPGVRFTGYLSDEDYANLLSGAACIVALTRESDCLQCAGYEALAIGVPFVTSDTAALRRYFGDAAIHVGHRPTEIAAGVERALTNADGYRARLAKLKARRKREGKDNLRRLREWISCHQGMGAPCE